ncbi:hypothetical protein K432DRAFT_404605 [Lepidopterella palustris CBS 459.81]|uniref:Uncharacterized protein n=1 Tax=Lepidopterella palustris CBS 459.81 TaxID=1314670 RepID=A0A8E2JFY7_9PEZI|nr:hypothetical protein K432DRAFT_404605 [Lepidopterella palustris CBS 459.81]
MGSRLESRRAIAYVEDKRPLTATVRDPDIETGVFVQDDRYVRTGTATSQDTLQSFGLRVGRANTGSQVWGLLRRPGTERRSPIHDPVFDMYSDGYIFQDDACSRYSVSRVGPWGIDLPGARARQQEDYSDAVGRLQRYGAERSRTEDGRV